MQLKSDIRGHPLYPYAEFAIHTIQHRFPHGAGDQMSEEHLPTKAELENNLKKFTAFSGLSQPNSQVYTHLLTDLTSGNADILSCYALGSLRRQFPQNKALFNLIYIHQTIPGMVTMNTHVLLVIGACGDVCSETLFTDNPNALICDLSSNDIYFVSDFHKRQIEAATLHLWFLLYHLPTLCLEGLSLHSVKPLRGELSIHPIKKVERFYQILEETVQIDQRRANRKLSAIECSDEAKHLPHQSIFAVSPAQQQEIWENDHPAIIGYVRDTEGVCHTIHRLTDTKHYAFWNEQTHTPTPITFRKEGDQHLSNMGPLSRVRPRSEPAEPKMI
ncbi:MAG: hypothetical protein NTU48_06780 [Legionellales bacterium]|nr:hypothetical protein [Legionellales bacterium]